MSYADPVGYDRFMGRWSARLAPLFVAFAGIGGCRRILDVGCGTGSLGCALLAADAATRLCGVDPSPACVAAARAAVDGPEADFRVGTAEALPFPDGAFDASLALLVFQIVADPDRAVGEMRRVTRPGGRVAACQWDFVDGFPMLSLFWEAARTVAPEEVARRHGNAALRHDFAPLWRRAGLADIRTATIEITMSFDGFDDYWTPFLAGATQTSAFAAELDRQTGGAVEAELRRRLVASPGRFELPARASAVVGTVSLPE